MMNSAYKTYLLGKWKEAEELAIKGFGVSKTDVVLSIFNKIAQSEYYWTKLN